MTPLVWVLVIVGATTIVNRGKIAEPVHRLAWWLASRSRRLQWLSSFPSCPLCVGFWVGVVVSLLGLSLVALVVPSSTPRDLRVFADGCAASGAAWIVHVVLAWLGAEKL